jgi:hypothetical protein
MPSVPIKFPTSSAPGMRPQEGAGRLLNAFTEKVPDGGPSDTVLRRSPGLTRETLAGYVQTRGFQAAGSNLLWIVKDRVIKVDSAFNQFDMGVLTGTDFVTTARNNKISAPDMVVVTSLGCFNLFDNSAPTPFADSDLPSTPTSVCDYNGYFVWSFGNGQIFASDLNAITVAGDSFTTEQGLEVRRVLRYAGRLYAFGDKWTGVYRDVGSSPFPFTREVTIPRGIVGTFAVSGWEVGWANQLIFVGDDFVVYRLDGYTPTAIGTPDVSRDIQAAILSGLRNSIVAYVYMLDNNAFWVLNCKDQFTWEYNATTGAWNERGSYQQSSWKGVQSVRIFDRWLIGDDTTGALYSINGNYFQEGTDFLVWEVTSGVMANFPFGVLVTRASFNMTTGVGVPPAIGDPVVEISWSLDGGYSFGDPVIRRLGGPGETKSHPYVLTCGLTRGQGIRFKLRVADAIRVRLFGGTIDVEQRGYSG